jgi:hypothetical protein
MDGYATQALAETPKQNQRGDVRSIAMSAQNDFWKWFIEHEGELSSFDPNQEAERERIFDGLALELQKVDPNLAFEFGPNESKREFVISAAGIRSAFPAVVSLAAAAPTLERWKVIAFRPRRPPTAVKFRDKCVDAREVLFTLLDNGSMAGISLFIPGLGKDGGDGDLKVIGYLLLDEALGEYDVETRLGLVEMLSPDTHTSGERYPLTELPRLFDQLLARLEGGDGKPS